MPIGFNSAARNLFLLGSSGADLVTNFFKRIDQSAGTDGVYLPDEIRYNVPDQKFLLAGSAEDSNSKGFGWFEKRDQDGIADWDIRVEAPLLGVNTTLRAMELDANDNLIVVGKTADIPWIAKYSNGGVIDWQSTTNSADVEYTGITSDANGNYYACGNTPVAGEAQAFVEKFDSSGTPGWGKSAFMLGRDVVLNRIAANSRGEVVAVGKIEDIIKDKGYIAKVDTATGDLLWDRTIEDPRLGQSSSYWQAECTDVYIDGNNQIYVVGNSFDAVAGTSKGFIIKYTAEGNIIWQKETPSDKIITFVNVKSDTETEQTVVFGTYVNNSGDEYGMLSKYSKDGSLVWRRVLYTAFDTFLSNVNLDADPSFYYLLFVDQETDSLSQTPDTYVFGKVSTSGNGLGNFDYTDGISTVYYETSSIVDSIGRLSDGSVRQDTSDLVTYPFGANKILFDDLATQVSNKKRQMDTADSFEYSGSPAIRVADFQELNLLGDVGIDQGDPGTPYSDGWQAGILNPTNSFDGSTTTGSGSNGGSFGPFTYTFPNQQTGVTSARLFVGFGASSSQVGGTTNTFLVNGIDVTQKAKDAGLYGVTSGWIDVTSEVNGTWNTFTIRGLSGSTNPFVAAVEVDGLILSGNSGVILPTWLDQSGKGNDGVVNGATRNASGWFDFDGVDDYILSSDVFSYSINEPITISLWFRTNTLTNDGAFYRRILNFTNNHGIITSPTDVGWYTAGANLIAPTPISTGVWYNVEYVYTGSQHQIYLNGELKNTETSSNAAINSVLWVGRYYGSNDGRFDGDIGEVRIYPRALTPAQVFQNYNATKSKYINEAPDTAPKIGPGIVYGSNLLLNYDFGNRATYDRTENLLSYSEQFNDASWFKNNYTITANSIAAPDGTLTADKIIAINASTFHDVYKSPALSTNTYTLSIFAKAAEQSFIQLRIDDGVLSRVAMFNLSTGSVSSSSNVTSPTITPYPDGWYRCSITVTTNIVNAVFGSFPTSSNATYSGDGVSGVFIWGAQVNEGGIGRYIKTTTFPITAPTTVKNLSSTSYTGTINGATFNSAGYFEFNNDGTTMTDWIEVQSFTGFPGGNNSYSYSFWMRTNFTDSTDNPEAVFFYGNEATGQAIRIRVSQDGAITVGHWGGPGYDWGTASVISSNTWHHICETYDGTTNENIVYVDGTQAETPQTINNLSIPTSATLYLGRRITSGTSGDYNGDIGGLLVYNRALTASEISKNFNATRSKYGV